MKQKDFDDLISGTKIGRSGGSGSALLAAQLHFVDGVKSIKDCAERAGCIRQSAQRTITQIKQLIDEAGMESVVVLVPKGKKARIEKLARSLRQEKS
jgi:hypothetical protein